MSAFFANARPGVTVTHGTTSFELPILYYRDDCFALFFTASRQALTNLLPSDSLHPIAVGSQRAIVGIAGLNYLETSIGAYGEVAVAVPVVFGHRPPPLLPALLLTRYPGFGLLVLHLPVTAIAARDAGRGQWGYTKFVADMTFENTPEYHQCSLSQSSRHILTARVAKGGMSFRFCQPLVTYSVKANRLIKTTIPQRGTLRGHLRSKGSFLRLGDHEVADSLRAFSLSPQPFMSGYFVERAAILPAGEVVQEGVRTLDGFVGDDRQGHHQTCYHPHASS